MDDCVNKFQKLDETAEVAFREFNESKEEGMSSSELLAILSVSAASVWAVSKSSWGKRMASVVSGASRSLFTKMGKALSRTPKVQTAVLTGKMGSSIIKPGIDLASTEAGIIRVGENISSLPSKQITNTLFSSAAAESGAAKIAAKSVGKKLLVRGGSFLFRRVVPVLNIAFLIYDVASLVGSTDAESDEEARTKETDIFNTMDNNAQADEYMARTLDNIPDDDIRHYSDNARTNEYVNGLIGDLGFALRNPGDFSSKEKFIKALSLLLNFAPEYVDDEISARQLGLQIMCAGSYMYDGSSAVVLPATSIRSPFPKSEVITLVSKLLQQVSSCPKVLGPHDTDEILAMSTNVGITPLVFKTSEYSVKLFMEQDR